MHDRSHCGRYRFGFAKITPILCLGVVLYLNSATASGAPVPPNPPKRPYEIKTANGSRTDEYFWMRDDERKSPEIIAHLEAENRYTDAVMATAKPAQEKLFRELVARIKQDDATAPVLIRGWWYYSRFEIGKQYPLYVRKKGSREAVEELMMDANLFAQGNDYFQIGSIKASMDGNILAFAQDTVGRLQWSLRFIDLVTGKTLQDRIENAESAFAWANDSKTLVYVEKDPKTLLGVRIRKHTLGTDAKDDPVLYEEKDNSFYMDVRKTRTDRYIAISLHSTLSSEIRYADASDPKLTFRVLIPRERDMEYDAEDIGDRWILRTNWKAKNFKIVEVPAVSVLDRTTWKDIIPHREDAFVQSFASFQNFLAISERSGGLCKIRIKAWKDGAEHLIAASEPCYTMSLDENPATDTDALRYSYTSLATPTAVYAYDMDTRKRDLLKQAPVEGHFDPAEYASEYLHAPARDGQLVPISLVHRKNFKKDGRAAILITGYGSYGICYDPVFSHNLLSLLDRDVVVAIAHVRGGQELGRYWYEDGKLLKKKNTFTDFIDAVNFLAKEGYASANRIAGEGMSAGGMLMGAVVNMAGDKFCAVVAHVPWVDVVSDMLDTSIPLTTNEFDEWGNPANQPYYDYMLSYSPYDNVKAKAFPALFVTGALHDSQVQYYNPAKWVSRLRDNKTNDNPVLLRMNMAASHGGKSGRFDRYHQVAEEYAFLFWRWGIKVE